LTRSDGQTQKFGRTGAEMAQIIVESATEWQRLAQQG
jgi:hypothetical protein